MTDLFAAESQPYQPLAARMRPTGLEDYIGQEHMLEPGKPLREAIDAGQLHSMILWGPPGVGKTSLARLLSQLCDAHFISVSAVLAGVKEIRQAVQEAREQAHLGRPTILFIDEVHRFNKAQQDAFLPFVEDGTVIFIGATTENPSFELNNALLSRTRVYRLRPLTDTALEAILGRALQRLGGAVTVPPEALSRIAASADGDARRALNLLELALEMVAAHGGSALEEGILNEVLIAGPRRFDKGGDTFYEQISALHKAVRGSAPDAALYWLCRMLDGGCDPLYIARRVVRMASEEIGNADPRALTVAMDAWQALERLGSPEGELALAQAVTYLSCAAKSNAVYVAFNAAMADVRQQPSYEVPLHLRNAPTALLKEEGHGTGYRYAHDEPDAYAAGENYFPPELQDQRYYLPQDRGLERKIQEKLNRLRELDERSPVRRYTSTSS